MNKCKHGANLIMGLPFGGCPDCRQEKTLAGGMGEVTRAKQSDLLLLGPLGNHSSKEKAKSFIDMTPVKQRMAMHQAFSKTGHEVKRMETVDPPKTDMTPKTGMCTWHQCQTPRTKDSRLCVPHKTLQAKLDGTPLPKGRGA